MYEVKLSGVKKFKDERVHDLLCCALEGGVGYWCEILEYGNPDNIKCEFRHLELPMSENGYLLIHSHLEEDADPDNKPVKLNKEALARGLQVMHDKYKWHYDNFEKENEDAETGDVFVQCAVFGKLIYG